MNHDFARDFSTFYFRDREADRLFGTSELRYRRHLEFMGSGPVDVKTVAMLDALIKIREVKVLRRMWDAS